MNIAPELIRRVEDELTRLQAAAATVERLREALEHIAAVPDDAMKVALTLHWDMRGWARAALEETP